MFVSTFFISDKLTNRLDLISRKTYDFNQHLKFNDAFNGL